MRDRRAGFMLWYRCIDDEVAHSTFRMTYKCDCDELVLVRSSADTIGCCFKFLIFFIILKPRVE